MPSVGYILPFPRFRAFDHTTGAPLAGGKLYAYQAGTVTPQNTYSDQGLTTPNANPVVLDANGEASVYIPDATLYKFVLKDSVGSIQWTQDSISVPSQAAAGTATSVPTGGLLPYGGSSAPTGYLLCDGSLVSRATYAALFTAIGVAYGAGDGSTTFALPDMRQRFPLGKAAGGTGSGLGNNGGAIDHTHTGPSHTHGVTVLRDGWGGASGAPTAGRLQAGGTGSGSEATVSQATTDIAVTSGAGGTGATSAGNPPYLVVNFIIKT